MHSKPIRAQSANNWPIIIILLSPVSRYVNCKSLMTKEEAKKKGVLDSEIPLKNSSTFSREGNELSNHLKKLIDVTLSRCCSLCYCCLNSCALQDKEKKVDVYGHQILVCTIWPVVDMAFKMFFFSKKEMESLSSIFMDVAFDISKDANPYFSAFFVIIPPWSTYT